MMGIRQVPDQPCFSSPRLLIRLFLTGMLVGLPGSAGIPACLFSVNASQQAGMPALPGKIDELVRGSGAETVAVAYYDLATGKELLINPDVSFHAASTMNVPLL